MEECRSGGMVDTHDSKSCLARGEGSSPSSGTNIERADHKKMKKVEESPKSLPKTIVICGPTATGKSDLAVLIAKKVNGEIISADSRQVYKNLDLGTGKITKKEMMGVPHYALDILDAKRTYTVDKYSKDGLKFAKEIIKKNKTPIICGGTGMYIDALVDGAVFPQVKPNKTLRKELSTYSTENLYKKLISIDQNRAAQLKNDNGGEFNRVRIIRSIEIATELGSVPQIEYRKNFNALFIGLDFDDKTLRDRILIRIRKRMKKGMLAEARNLHQNGLSFKRMRELGLEYRHLADLLEKKVNVKEFEEKLALDIWHFVKRQRTWFKRNKEIAWFTPNSDSFNKAIKMSTDFLEIKNGKKRPTINSGDTKKSRR